MRRPAPLNAAAKKLAKRNIDASQHFTGAPAAPLEASWSSA
jgi:hypothetical protein